MSFNPILLTGDCGPPISDGGGGAPGGIWLAVGGCGARCIPRVAVGGCCMTVGGRGGGGAPGGI